jgi:glycosyltransferase involved in cell wall biosynthesis
VNRSVIIVTPFFAPQNHAAVFRAYKLVKYLPQFGWKPIVITADTQYEYNEDDQLLAALPEEVEIISTRYIEPTLRGVRMALGGRDRTFQGLKASSSHRGASPVAGKRLLAARAYHYFLYNWLHRPDVYWTWAKSAISGAEKIMAERGIHLVFTTAPPYSSLLIGASLQRAGARWIADFRDPLAYTNQLSSPAATILHQQREIVRHALHHADAITLASSSMASIYRDMFGPKGKEPIFIPTGVDQSALEDGFPAEKSDEHDTKPFLLFAGEVLPEFDPVFWETFAKAMRNEAVRSTGIKILIVGTLALNHPRMMPFLHRYGMEEHVEFRDQLPQREIYKLLRKARAGLLVPGINSRWWTNAAKMTDYIGMRKPVVAVVPDPSEARMALTRSRLGVFLDGCLERRASLLTDFLLGTYQLSEPDAEECDRYTAHRQVQSFAELFESFSSPQ